MKSKFKVRNIPVEIEFEMCDGELDDFVVVKVADSENEELKEYFYNLINTWFDFTLKNECLKAIKAHNEQIKIERYLDADPR